MSFRIANERTLADVIKELISSYRMGGKLKEANLIESWEQIVGKMIASHTIHLRIHKRILYVEVDSAALRNELTYARDKIKKALNKDAGEQLIDDIVFR